MGERFVGVAAPVPRLTMGTGSGSGKTVWWNGGCG